MGRSGAGSGPGRTVGAGWPRAPPPRALLCQEGGGREPHPPPSAQALEVPQRQSSLLLLGYVLSCIHLGWDLHPRPLKGAAVDVARDAWVPVSVVLIFVQNDQAPLVTSPQH